MRVVAIIPALNEEGAIGKVVSELSPSCVAVIVADNGSTDHTALRATTAGAHVVHEPMRGYGAACLAGIAYAAQLQPDIILFADGDYADDPAQAVDLLEPLLREHADLVIGSRALGEAENGSLTPVQRFGNWLSTSLIRMIWKVPFTDLGPFRAIRWDALKQLQMQDQNYGWTVEMQIKAAAMGLRCREVPVRYRRRIGSSKVSGTVKGSIMAGVIILRTIARYALR